MSKPLNIGTTSVLPGETKRGAIVAGIDMAGTPRATPIIVCRGVEDGPILWINGATHGDEPEGAFSIFMTLAEHWLDFSDHWR